MPISFPSLPSSGQRYEFSFNAWTYNGTFWQATGSSGQITSGAISDNAIFSGNIASGSISAFNLASGVGGSSLVLTSGSITSGLIGDNAVNSGNIASGQVGQYQINDYNVGVLNNIRGGDYGYFAGGSSSGTFFATAEKLTYSSDTAAAQTTANLSQGRGGLAGISEGLTKGYFAGGNSQSGAANIIATNDKITYSTNTSSAQASANLSQARAGLAGIGGERNKGYFAGGLATFSSYVTTADKLTYSTDSTAAQTTANLSQARRSFGGVSDGLIKGYFAGGDTNNAVATAEKLTYSTDSTAAQTTANLTQARIGSTGCSGEGTKGYFTGGYTGAGVDVATSNKINYSTDTTASLTTSNLSQARSFLAGISEGSKKGYFAGGQTGSTVVVTADKLTYSTDATAAQTSANLSQARSTLAGVGQEYTTVFGNNCVFSGNISSSEIGLIHFGFSYPTSGLIKSGNIGDNSVNSGNIGSGQIGRFQISYFNPETNLAKGYFAGGSTGDYVATADKLTYSTDTTAAQTTANLSQIKSNLAGVSDGTTKGYFAGGSNAGGFVATADKITYSNDTTVSQTTANLSQARSGLAGCSGQGTKGYFAGGTTNVNVATADKLTYATDTTVSQTTANLSQSRGGVAGISEGSTKGYFAGGIDGGLNYVVTADKLTYSTDTTVAQASANLSQARTQLTGCSGDSTKGYFAGGSTNGISGITTANKLTYATDATTAQTTANLSQARYGLAGVSEGTTKGYFAGGFSDSYAATADKLTYSTDTTIAQTTANLSQARRDLTGIGQIFANTFGNNSITSGNIASGQIGQFHFISGVIRTATNIVNSGSFGNSSVNSGNIASGVVSQFHFSDYSIYSDSVRSGNVSTFKFSNNAVFSGNISSSNTITTVNLASGGVQSGAFGDNAISSGDILSGRITSINISSGEFQSFNIASGSINSTKLASGAAVGAFKLASGIVVSGNIASGSIFFTPFIDGAIESGNIASGAIGNIHLGNESVTSGAVPSGTVIFNMVGANATVAYNFSDVALASGNFALQSVTGENLADGLWPIPTAFFVSGGITAFMFDNNSIVSGSLGTLDIAVVNFKTGYFAGGYNGAEVVTAEKLNSSNDTTIAQASANLSQAREGLAGISEGSTKGYFAGGSGIGFYTTADKLTYSTDSTAAQTSANLSQARYDLAGCSGEGTKGYFAGGNTNQGVTTADKLTYSTDTTIAQASANLSQARFGLAGISEGTTKGYFAGGVTGASIRVLTADKLTYSTDTTAAQTTANLSQARAGLAGCSGEGTKGYFAGGFSSVSVATADKLTYSTDTTAAQTTANLSQARFDVASFSNGTIKGYFAGGNDGSYLTTADLLTYSTDTTIAKTTANLSQARRSLAGIMGGDAPYNDPRNGPIVISGKLTTTEANEIRFTNMASGSVVSGNIVSGVVFSDATTNNFSNAGVRSGNIASGQVGRVHIANETILSGNIGSGVINFPTFFGDTTTYTNIASGQIDQYHLYWTYDGTTTKAGYFAGGISPILATTDKLKYSTDTTVAQTSANLSQGRYSLAGVSEGSIKGYFAGGVTGLIAAIADKITYSNSTTVAQTSANLIQDTTRLCGCSGEGTKGYFAGGINSIAINVATANKLTYSTDTTAAQTSADLSQARSYLTGVSEGSTKGYFAGGTTGTDVATVDKLIYSTDTTAAQASANLSQARIGLAGCSGDGTKGYFVGGVTGSFVYQKTADKLTYSTDTTTSQTTADLSQEKYALAGVSEGSTKGYFAGGDTGQFVATADKVTYSTDANSSQTTANLSQARYFLAGVDGGQSQNTLPTDRISSAYLTSSKLSSGTIGLTTASGQNAAFPYHLSETAQINTNQPMFDYFVFQEQCSGIKAVCIASGSRVVRAQRASGMRLPAIGVTSGTVNSGSTGRVYYYGYVGRVGTFAANSGLYNGISGFQGRPLYVGSGGNIVNLSGFWVGGVQQAPFISGNMQQQIGIAMSGGLFVMPSPRVVRSGFQGILPYDHPA